MKKPRKLTRPTGQDRLEQSFYDRPTTIVARELLGKALIRRVENRWVGGMIVETEAYLAENDPACHANRGITPSNSSMFGPPGTLYVYPIHATHCMNAVTEKQGIGCAVLIRAIEPIWGIATMRSNRGYDDLRRLARGPGMLCQALQIDRQCDGISLVHDRDAIIANLYQPYSLETVATPRVGISKAKSSLLRFVIAGNEFPSGKVR